MDTVGTYTVDAVFILPTRSPSVLRYEVIVSKPDDPTFGAIFYTLNNWKASLCQVAAKHKGQLLRIGTTDTQWGANIVTCETL